MLTLTGMIGVGKSALAAAVRRADVVVLDDCEHAAAHATELLAHDGVRVLATSRGPLGIPGEVVFPVRPLGDAAAELFLRRVASPGLDLAVVAEICAELDGVPAAVELAADGLRDGDLAELLRRVVAADDGTGVNGASLARAAFARCSDDEVAVCAELSRLAGPFSVKDVAHVCAAPVVAALRERSILSRVDGGPEPRYALPRIFRRHLRSMARSRPRRRDATVPRTALLAGLESRSDARLRLVTGPAGAGKSVVLRQLAARSGHPVVRCAGSLTGPLVAALGLPAGTGVPGVLDSLTRDGVRRTIYVDDAHTLAGQPDETALTRLVEQAPPWVRFVVATRDDRSLRAVPGSVYRVGYDQLRMTPDEVATLFATAYRTPLPEREAAALCARVDGLAVALRLVHLDTVALGPARRAAALCDPLRHSDRLREFLVRDVLGAVPEPMRAAMVDLSPFGVLDPAVCDAHLGRTDSARLLAELAGRQAFTFRDTAYRFHPLLRQLLDDLHVQQRGPRLTRQDHHGAARRLAAAGHRAAAYRAYARAGDWQSAARFRPEEVIDDDPWILLAEARRLRGDGRFADACDNYQAAAHRMTDQRVRWTCELERARLTHWLVDAAPGSPLDDDVSAHLVAAVRGAPADLVAMALPSDSPEWTLGRAVAAVLDGRPALATELAESVAGRADPFASLAARLLTAVVRACRYGQGSVAAFGDLADEADDLGWPWLARIARAATAVLSADACDTAAAIVAACDERGDDWGALLAAHLRTAGLTRACRPSAQSRADAAARAARLGARLPDDWLGNGSAMVPRPRLVLAERLSPPVEVRCLGPFTLTVSGRPVDVGGLRAQARRLLRMLSMQYGSPMHEERLVAALWPDAALDRAKHRLHVAISSVRALLRAQGGSGVTRQGSTYLLALPEGSVVDVVAFEDALRRWRTGKDVRELDEVRDLGEGVLDLYRGELLVEEGAAEWVLTRREAIRADAVGVAAELGRLELERGDLARAVEVCARGLTVDERDYRLWTLLAEARQREGNPGAARRARGLYRALVAEG